MTLMKLMKIYVEVVSPVISTLPYCALNLSKSERGFSTTASVTWFWRLWVKVPGGWDVDVANDIEIGNCVGGCVGFSLNVEDEIE